MELPESIVNKALDDVYENLIKVGAKSLSKTLCSLDVFKQHRMDYFDSLYAQHGKVRILGMTSPMPTEALYIPVKVSEDISGNRYIDPQYINYINENKKIPVAIKKELERALKDNGLDAIDVLEKGRQFVLLGGSGSGKTTLLRYLALAYCGKIEVKSKSDLTPLFPIFISLRDVTDQKCSLLDLFRNELAVAKFPEPSMFLERLLEKGRCIILIDGLDEVPVNYQEKISDQLRKFSGKYFKAKVIISSRIAKPLKNLESFTELQICQFGLDQIVKFSGQWFAGEQSKKGKSLAELISRDVHLLELATTPLLLTLICILYKHDLRIPTNRSELYERCVECLLREWDTSRGFRRETKFV